MTALNATTLQVIAPASMALKVGSSSVDLKEIYIRVTSTGTDDTLALSTYLPGGVITNIVETLDAAQNGGTANTWSGTDITFDGHAGSGVWDLIVYGY